MFGSSKSVNGKDYQRAARDSGLTGLERAKLERGLMGEDLQFSDSQEPDATQLETVFKAETSKPVATSPGAPSKRSAAEAQTPATESAAHLYAGPGVKLKGEITGCDTLRIDGTFDGNAIARQLILCPGGKYLGVAQIDEAEIEGTLDGTLTVRGRLFLRSKGRVSGTLSYGQLEVECGGEIAGQIVPHEKKSVVKPPSGVQTMTEPEVPSGAKTPLLAPQPSAPVMRSVPSAAAALLAPKERLSDTPATPQSTTSLPLRAGTANAQIAQVPRLSSPRLSGNMEETVPQGSAAAPQAAPALRTPMPSPQT